MKSGADICRSPPILKASFRASIASFTVPTITLELLLHLMKAVDDLLSEATKTGAGPFPAGFAASPENGFKRKFER